MADENTKADARIRSRALGHRCLLPDPPGTARAGWFRCASRARAITSAPAAAFFFFFLHVCACVCALLFPPGLGVSQQGLKRTFVHFALAHLSSIFPFTMPKAGKLSRASQAFPFPPLSWYEACSLRLCRDLLVKRALHAWRACWGYDPARCPVGSAAPVRPAT